YHLARKPGAVAGGLHLHTRRRLAHAGGREHPLALDLDHAGPAIAVGAIAGLWQPAQMRDLDALAVGDLPDRLARSRLDFGSVEGKADRLGHIRSSRKCFSTCLTGFIAACPSPQIEASVMTCVSSCNSGSSQCGIVISLTAFSVPARQ